MLLLLLTIICGFMVALFVLLAVLATFLARSTDEGSTEEEESQGELRDFAQAMGSVARYSAIAFAIGFVVLLVLVLA